MTSQPKPPADPAVPFLEVLATELANIESRRTAVLGPGGDAAATPAAGASGNATHPAIRKAQQVSTLGLAFSGGGIRSATFNLGVLQGLAEKGLLKYVDYLSTVSGGGYIGSWLHGVMRRAVTPPRAPQLDDAAKKTLAQGQLAHAEKVLRSGVKQEPGPSHDDPITFLRKYSNYLAPRPGLFSADTWTIGFIWLRNVLLNQLILVPAIAAIVSLVLLLTFLVQLPSPFHRFGVDLFATAVAVVCLIVARSVMVKHLAPIARRSVAANAAEADAAAPGRSSGIATVGFAFAAMVALGAGSFAVSWPTFWVASAVFAVVLGSIQIDGGFVDCYLKHNTSSSQLEVWWQVSWMAAVSGLVAALLVTGVWSRVAHWQPWTHFAFGPPLIGVCVIAAVMLLVGLMGADYPDAAREWTAKIGSLLGITTAAWLALFALMVFGPWAVSYAVGSFQKSGAAAVAVWVFTTLGGVLAGRSPRTAKGDTTTSGTGRALEILVAVAPTIFLVGYIVATAAGVHAVLPTHGIDRPARVEQTEPKPVAVSIQGPARSEFRVSVKPEESATLQRWLQPAADFAARYPDVLALNASSWSSIAADGAVRTKFVTILFLLGGTLFVAVVASRRVNINEFSLHHFYKNRLVRCYLGASHARDRKPHPLTGFDPRDDVPIARLSATSTSDPYFGPYPIINTALNLNAGSELATQERKAASFVFTPEYCGFSTKSVGDDGNVLQEEHIAGDVFDVNGYRPTAKYAYAGGPDVGTGMAISGAAANPNWGYHTSGPMAFLLTVFNARLGWWLGNTRYRQASREPGPRFALKYLFLELLAQTTGRTKFVNLSDGGHYDNLGLYELIRRRCRFIIVCDAEEDHALTFGSLGAVIRKCRADFGVEIDINPAPIREGAAGYSSAHCVVGTIRYPDEETAFSAKFTDGFYQQVTDGGRGSRGWLLYLKSSLTGDEPADVIEYRSQFPAFPHQSTGDQFFSESQFESYRRLGYHVLRSAFEQVSSPGDVVDRAAIAGTAAKDADRYARYPLIGTFQELLSKWYAPIPVTAEAATRLANAYVELMRRIAADSSVQLLNSELQKGEKDPNDTRPAGQVSPAEVAIGMDLMQLVQNVYTEFGLEGAFNRANPRNSGWMSVFRKWWRSPILSERIWPQIKHDYHALFQEFVENLGEEPEVPERP